MYGYRPRPLTEDDDPQRFVRLGKDPALQHEGDYLNLLDQHRSHVAELAIGRQDVRPIGPLLRRRIAAAPTMYCALRDTAAHGGAAPGPDGVRLEGISKSVEWELCRELAKEVRTGRYRPGPDRKVRIAKSSGHGFRTITIQNVADRIVARAAVLILDPVTDPNFSPFSFGFRPDLNTHDALAVALSLATAEGRTVWVAADVANAFDVVPHQRFLDLCRKHFPKNVVSVIDRITGTGDGRGLRQGSPASPFFFNLYADSFINRAFQKRVADGRLLRYADDLLVLCRTADEAEKAGQVLATVARAGGLPLKEGMAVVNMESGVPLDWLSYRVQWKAGAPAVTIAPKAWTKLAADLEEAHLKPFAALRANERIHAWFDYLGPCYAVEDRDTVVARVHQLATAQGFDELPSAKGLKELWLEAFGRWKNTQRDVENQLPEFLTVLTTWKDGAAGGWK